MTKATTMVITHSTHRNPNPTTEASFCALEAASPSLENLIFFVLFYHNVIFLHGFSSLFLIVFNH